MLAEIRDEKENKEVRNLVRKEFNDTKEEGYLWIGMREKFGLILMFYANTHTHAHTHMHTHIHTHTQTHTH